MSLEERFEEDLLALARKYETKYGVALEQVDLKKSKDALGTRLDGARVAFSRLKAAQDLGGGRKRGFLRAVLLPSVFVFLVAVIFEVLVRRYFG